MNTITNVDYSSYSDDELEQAIKDIQKVKANRKASSSNKQKIFIRSLSNSENESLSKDQNMLKTYIFRYVYTTQNNRNDSCSVGLNFSTTNSCNKNDSTHYTNSYWWHVNNLISFSYNEI